MSTFIYSDNYSSSFFEKDNKKISGRSIKEKFRKLLILFIVILVGIVAFQVIWNFLILPNMRLRDLQIISETDFPEDPMKVKAVTGLDAGMSYTDIDPRRIRSLLLENLMIEDAVVEKRFPDRVVIRLRERVPVAIGLFETADERSIPVLFDKEGYVVFMGFGVNHFDFPVLSGDYKFPLPVQGEKLGLAQSQLLTKLSEIREENRELYKLISEVEIRSRGSENFDLLLYVRGHSFPLILKQNFTQQKLLRGIGAMDALRDTGYDKYFKTIDFRSEDISFEKRDGGQNGN